MVVMKIIGLSPVLPEPIRDGLDGLPELHHLKKSSSEG